MQTTIFARRFKWLHLAGIIGLGGLALKEISAEPQETPAPTPQQTPVLTPQETPAPNNPDSPAPATGLNALPSPGPMLQPSPSDALPTASDNNPSPEAARLFNDNSNTEQAPAVTEEQRRASALLQAQNLQAASDLFSSASYQRAETMGEALFNGIGGVPQALNPLYLVPGSTEAQGFKLGPLALHPILSIGLNYGSTSGKGTVGESGFYGSVSPAFSLTLGEPATGRTLTGQYTGSLTFGDTDGNRVRYDQALFLSGALNFVKLNLGFSLDFSELTSSDRDFGGQAVDREIIGLSLTGSYIFSEKTNLSASMQVPIRLYSRGDSSEGVSGNVFANYIYSPLTTFGLGVTLGTVGVQQNAYQVYEQILARLTYIATQKLNFNGTAGFEFRQADSREENNPVFGLGVVLTIREGTTLSLNAERRVVNSAADIGTNYTDTTVTISLGQRLGQFFELTLTTGYENSVYQGVTSGVSSNRNDNQLILQGSLSYRFKERWLISEIISYSQDFSNQNSFQSFQNSLQLTYVF